jgi:hypothetical protein
MKKLIFTLIALSLTSLAYAGPMVTGQGSAYPQAVNVSTSGNLTVGQLVNAQLVNHLQATTAAANLTAAFNGGSFFMCSAAGNAAKFALAPASETFYVDGTPYAGANTVYLANATAGACLSAKTFPTGASTWAWFFSLISGSWLVGP